MSPYSDRRSGFHWYGAREPIGPITRLEGVDSNTLTQKWNITGDVKLRQGMESKPLVAIDSNKGVRGSSMSKTFVGFIQSKTLVGNSLNKLIER